MYMKNRRGKYAFHFVDQTAAIFIWFLNSVFPMLSESIISFECYVILTSRETLVINVVPFPLYVIVTTFT